MYAECVAVRVFVLLDVHVCKRGHRYITLSSDPVGCTMVAMAAE